MEVRPVPDVLEDVAAFAEARLADPARALATHVGVAGGRAVHELREVMAADPGQRPAPLRDPGGGVVRASGAEVGGALHRGGVRIAAFEDRFERRDPGRQIRATSAGLLGRRARHIANAVTVTGPGEKPAADLDRDMVGVEPSRGGEQRPAVLVALAHDARRVRGRVQHVLELRLDQRALLLDDDDGVEPLGEAPRPLRLQREGHRHLVQPDPEPPPRRLVDAQILERLPHVEVGLAGGRHPQPRPVRIPYRAVEAVGARERLHRFELVLVQTLLLLLGRVRPADPQPLGGHGRVVREDDLDPLRIDLHRGGGLDGVVHTLERGPAPAVARQGEGVEPEVQDLLHPGRIEHRDRRIDHRVLAVVRGGRGFAGVVVAEQRDGPAKLRGPGQVRMAQHVAGTVHPRPLAVPEAEHPVVRALAVEPRLLRAPAGGGRDILVDAGLKHHVMPVEMRLRAPELLVEPAER